MTPSQIGSVEFAASKPGARLAVVLGRSRCGAVEATLGQLRNPPAENSPNLGAIVDHIKPAVEDSLDSKLQNNPAELMEEAIRAIVRASARCLQNESAVIDNLVRDQQLTIACAEYSLETGDVALLEC